MRSPGLAERVGDRALDWLSANRARFEPPSGEVPVSEAGQTALAELAQLSLHLARRDRFAGDRRVHDFLELVDRVYRRPAFHEFPFRVELRSLAGHLLIWLALRERGIEKLVPAHLFAERIDAYAVAVAAHPAKLLELRYLLKLGGFGHRLPPEDELLGETVLAHAGPPDELDDDRVYELTHVVFYVTDFGLQGPSALSGEWHGTGERVLRLLEGMITRRHWDLVSELILSHRCLGGARHPSVQAAWQALHASQEASGRIRHPPELGGPVDELPPGEPRQRYLFARCYHQTLVAAMAAFLGP